MTVCIVTMTRSGTVLGAADRMKTAGDAEYEPETSKIFKITNSIAAMTSGDSAFQGEILNEKQIVEAACAIPIDLMSLSVKW